MESLDRLWLRGQDFHPLWTSAFPRRTELSRIDKLNKTTSRETWFIAWNVWATRSH